MKKLTPAARPSSPIRLNWNIPESTKQLQVCYQMCARSPLVPDSSSSTARTKDSVHRGHASAGRAPALESDLCAGVFRRAVRSGSSCLLRRRPAGRRRRCQCDVWSRCVAWLRRVEGIPEALLDAVERNDHGGRRFPTEAAEDSMRRRRDQRRHATPE